MCHSVKPSLCQSKLPRESAQFVADESVCLSANSEWIRRMKEKLGLHSVNDQVVIVQEVSVDVPDIVGTDSDVSRPFDIHI